MSTKLLTISFCLFSFNALANWVESDRRFIVKTSNVEAFEAQLSNKNLINIERWNQPKAGFEYVAVESLAPVNVKSLLLDAKAMDRLIG